MQPSFAFTPYQYAPLPTPSSIRLVSLLKPHANTPRPSIAGLPLLQLSIETADLNDKPDFTALSYTWGSPFDPDSKHEREDYDGALHRYPIAIDGRLLLVGRNLYEFLYQSDKDDTDTDPDVDRRFPPFNKTGLIRAAEEGRLQDVRDNLSRSADLSAQDKFGETALHYAAENGYLEIVKLLVKAGASQTRLDSARRTPLDCARMRRRRQYRQVIAFLEHSELQQQEELSTVELPLKRSRHLWIDAICSNQESIPERNAQVALMPRIYSSARKIVIWLGIADELTAAGYEVLNRPGPQESWAQDEQVWRMTVREVAEKFDPDRENFEDLSPDAARAFKEYHGVASLRARTWFRRSWTLQEVLLGTDYEYRCGKYVFTHFNFNSIVDARADWHGDEFGSTRALNPVITQHMRADESALRSPGVAALNSLSLQTLVAITDDAVATDPRDRLFALLSLARQPDNPQHVITADYSIPVDELFTRFAASFMEGCPDRAALEPLEGLSYVQVREENAYSKNLPSWVPDFGSPPGTCIIWSRRFHAATELGIPTIIPLDDPRLLCVVGVMIDEIEAIEPVTQDTYFPAAKRWMQFIQPLAPTYHTGESRSEALWRTLITNHIWLNAPASAAAEEGFRKHVLWELGRSPLDPETGHLLDDLQATGESKIWPSKEAVEEHCREVSNSTKTVGSMRQKGLGNPESNFDVKCTEYLKTRSLFRTKKGYLGLGPNTAQLGDQVWLIAGTRVPFILQRNRANSANMEGWTLVGEAYVHGLMEGEAAKERSINLEPVVLF